MELISFINETFWGSSGYMVLLAVSIFYILLRKERHRRGTLMAVYSVLVFVCVICNPLLGLIATQKFMSDDAYAYLRIFYVLPLMSVIAYAITEFYTEQVPAQAKTGKKVLIAAILAVLVMMAGQLYDSSMYVKAENVYKISEDALEICEIIREDHGAGQTRALVPGDEDIAYGIRQYTGDIVIPAYSDDIHDTETLKRLEEEKNFVYVALKKEITRNAVLEENGYVPVGETFEYVVYRKQ